MEMLTRTSDIEKRNERDASEGALKSPQRSHITDGWKKISTPFNFGFLWFQYKSLLIFQ